MARFKVIDKTTGKEADEYEIARTEEWAKDLCYCDMDGFAIMQDGSLILCDECGRFEYCDESRFSVVWEEVQIPVNMPIKIELTQQDIDDIKEIVANKMRREAQLICEKEVQA